VTVALGVRSRNWPRNPGIQTPKGRVRPVAVASSRLNILHKPDIRCLRNERRRCPRCEKPYCGLIGLSNSEDRHNASQRRWIFECYFAVLGPAQRRRAMRKGSALLMQHGCAATDANNCHVARRTVRLFAYFERRHDDFREA
jgi:hypothetical protein